MIWKKNLKPSAGNIKTENKVFLLFFILVSGFRLARLGGFLFSPPPSLAFTLSSPRPVQISALVGSGAVTIFGYTSPNSKVELSNPQVYDQTYSLTDGFFVFNRTILPYTLADLCLSSTDESGRRTTPVCVPPPPLNDFHSDIGPILLAPTLSLDRSDIHPNSTIIASGQSIPNSQVSIYFFQTTDQAPAFPRFAQAFSLPKLTVSSQADGSYSFSLPTAYASDYRLFSTAQFLDEPTPKSNILTFHLPSLWYLFWSEYWVYIIFTPLLIITLSYFFYLIYLYLNPNVRTGHWPVPATNWLTLYPKSLITIK